MTTILRQLNQDINGVVETARRSLVRVVDGQRGAGAGTIWHSDGMIITNAHVVGNGRNLRVVMQNGEDLPARVFAYNAALDLAALAVDAHELPTTELGDSKSLQAGAWVMAVGHPWGVVGAVTGGTVIGLGASLPDMPLADREWLAVNLHMRPGHSGGALIDTEGRLLGVNTMISGPDIGLAVPVHVVKQFLKTELQV